MRIHTVLVFAALVLGGCGVGSIAEMQAQATDTEKALEKEFGTKPKVNWRMFNGTLTSVDVAYDSKAVSGLSVQELNERTQRIVIATFKDKPKHVAISVSVPQ